MQKYKIFVVGNSKHITSFINKSFEFVKNINEANLVIFTGGSDISPDLYFAKKHQSTYCDIKRDQDEYLAYDEAIRSTKKPLILGICRGAQLLCALNGGKIIQNVNNHTSAHDMLILNSQSIIKTSSCHHQMMYPFDLPHDEYEILAQSSKKISNFYQGDCIDEEKVIVEPEVIFFKKTRSLGIQGHPEFIRSLDDPFVIYSNKLIKKYILKK